MLYDPTKAKTFENKLTPQFLSAEELKVTEKMRQAFIAVHEALLKGDIPKNKFRMNTVGKPSWKNKECGTPGCLLGWAMAYGMGNDSRTCFPMSLDKLCYPNVKGAIGCTDRNKARQALENWLTTGDANWQFVMEID